MTSDREILRKRKRERANGKATMDALLKAVGAKWKFRGFRKVRKD